MKLYIALFILVLLLIGCYPSDDREGQFLDLQPPIILVAKDSSGNVIVKDKTNTMVVASYHYAFAKAIAATYSQNDTIITPLKTLHH
jgi:ABC-type Fe3+-citrate transport system substrate-binding protein